MQDSILEFIVQGESAGLEFKEKEVRPDTLAREMAAFANIAGGIILSGVSDTGKIEGFELDKADESISNIATHNVDFRTKIRIKSTLIEDKKVVSIEIAKGKHNP